MKQTGRSAVKPSLTGGELWSYRTGKGIFSTAVIDGAGNVYIGSADRYFYALDKTGAERWKVLNGEIVDSSALLDDKGRVYYGSGDGILRALDTRTGAEVWKFHAEAPEVNNAYINWFEGNVAIGPDGTLYAPNDNNALYAVNRDGTQKWKWPMNDQTWSLPAIDPETGNLFVGNNYIAGYAWMTSIWRNTFAISPDGHEVWGHGVQAGVAASPMLTDDGKMIVGAFDGYVRAYSQATGDVLWEFATNDHIYSSPGSLSDGTVIQPSSDGTVYALDPATGRLKWAFDTREPIRSSPSIDGDDNIYFGGGDGRLYVLNKGGTLRFSMGLVAEDRNDFGGSAALGRDAIVIAGESGEIFSVPYDYCLRAEAATDARCDRGGRETLPSDGTFLFFTTPLGSIALEAPKKIAANQPMAFSLVRREAGDSKLALLDEDTLKVEVTPAADVSVDTSGDRRFVTVVPKTRFTPNAEGKLHLKISGKYLVNPTRSGLLFSGGTTGGLFSQEFDFELGAGPDGMAFPVPAAPGDPSGVFELQRIAVPYPTVMPSYNQIGFDSLHYLVGMVEGTSEKSIGWVVGGMLAETENKTLPDPATKVLFPVDITYKDGLMNMVNESGFTVNAMNFDMPFDLFRVSAHLNAAGVPVSQPGVHVKTKCNNIEFYGPFLAKLGFCNPRTDLLNVYGSTDIRPHQGGVASAPAGIGTVKFALTRGWFGGAATNPYVTATLTGTSLKLADHSYGVLLVDAATGKPVSIKYGLATARTATSTGNVETVSVNFLESLRPAKMRAYLMVDTYPAAMGLVE